MNKWMVSTALAAFAVVAPVAVADGVKGKTGAGPEKGALEKSKSQKAAPKAKMVEYVFRGVVTEDATTGSVTVEFEQGNKHVRRALGDAETITVKIGAKTKVRLTEPRRRGSFADLKAGDEVRIEIRARRGTSLANLPAAKLIVDRGVAEGWMPPSDEPPVDEPPADEPPVDGPPPDLFGELG